MLTDKEQKELFENIARLGGKGFKEDDIVYDGDKFVLPKMFENNPAKALKAWQAKVAEADEATDQLFPFNYRPWDGAVCAYRAIKKAFGFVRGEKIPGGFFSPDQPPEYIQIPISPTETESVPWGRFSIPQLEGGYIEFGSTMNRDYGQVFVMSVHAARKFHFFVDGLAALCEEEMKTGSIYKGKAIDGQTQPTFISLEGVDPAKVVYSDQVQTDLETHIWSVMRYPDANKELGLSLKRAILMFGTYGTGKSLAGYLTAKEAVASGWTFLMARPGRDNFLQVMQTARLYQPAIVFFEDAETMASVEQSETMSQVLDMFDGIQAKGASLMVVLTTNHPELIHKGMNRPGRIDAQIEIGELDAKGIQRLIEASIPETNLSAGIAWEQVVTACEGYVPAFVKEVADRSLRYALNRNGGEVGAMLIDTVDLVHAAGGLRSQFQRMQDAPEHGAADQTLGELIQSNVQKATVALVPEQNARADVWDVEKLAAVSGNGHRN